MLITWCVSRVIRVHDACSTVDLTVERTVFGWALVSAKMGATVGVTVATVINGLVFIALSLGSEDLGNVSLVRQAMLYPLLSLIFFTMYAPIYASFAQRDFEKRQDRCRTKLI